MLSASSTLAWGLTSRSLGLPAPARPMPKTPALATRRASTTGQRRMTLLLSGPRQPPSRFARSAHILTARDVRKFVIARSPGAGQDEAEPRGRPAWLYALADLLRGRAAPPLHQQIAH